MMGHLMRLFPMLMHLVVTHLPSFLVHHPQHGRSTSLQEADDQHGGEDQEEDVEDRGIVPLHACGDGSYVAVLRNYPKSRKQELHRVASSSHGEIEGDEDKAHDLPAIIFAIDIQDRNNDQVGKNEADHAAKADPATPQHGSQWYVANRAHEADHRDERPDERTFDCGPGRIIREEKGAPEGFW